MPPISNCSMMPEWHQLVRMSGHVEESETARKLQLYATSIGQVHSFVNWTITRSVQGRVLYDGKQNLTYIMIIMISPTGECLATHAYVFIMLYTVTQ